MSILRTVAVQKTYSTRGIETQALNGVDLTIEAGEFTALAGPSGSGKTTLLNLLGALDVPTSGKVLLDEEDLASLTSAELSERRLHKLGFVFQAYNLIPVLNAAENVEFVLELQGIKPHERRQRASQLLERVGLAEMAKKRPPEMSGGQQQRVAVARAIASEPQVILADEPTANLDSTTARNLLDLMQQLNQEEGTTFLFSSHDPLVLEKAKRRILLRDGLIEGEEQGPYKT
ncbi:MAG: macrolide ABC transporter ATP-binding protein [Deltaproteobacteria bacterium]|nr:macrolide ABC transporter ATP-binding protein [Deltaproteobacteria bacterium]